MNTIYDLGKGMTATYCPEVSATRTHYGTLAHFKYHAIKTKNIKEAITYQRMCEWTRQVCEEVRMTFEKHYNTEMKKNTRWGIMPHPSTAKIIRELKFRGTIKNVKISIEFIAETDIFYPSSKYDHLIKTYFHFEDLN